MGTHFPSDNFAHPWLSGEIDVNELKRRHELFSRHHKHRINQTRERITVTARHIFNALPLLLHANHPSLPGFINSQTPYGIHGYSPDADSLRAVRQFTPGFSYAANRQTKPALDALYFMGSAGSVAHTRSSDLDLWVCLPAAQHQLMDAKLSALTQWAASHGVELQCFAVDPAQFTGGTELAFSPLLLDEFYRTACLVAGKYPLWWLVPNNASTWHSDIARRLVVNKYIATDASIDFGPVTTFTTEELYAAGVRELENSLTTPHKSLLKLALLESYHAGQAALSRRYKDLVIDASATAEIDGYLMLADHLDAFFSTHHEFDHRQLFMQRAWLIKTGRGNARLMKNTAWWSHAQRWGYSKQAIENLRWPHQWPLADIINEHHRTMAEFAHALSFLSELKNRIAQTPAAQTSISTERRMDLSDRLKHMRSLLLQHTQYNDKLLHALLPATHQGNAEVVSRGDEGWCLREQGRDLIRRPSLVQIFLWLKRQGLGLSSLRLDPTDEIRHRQIFAALDHEPYVAIINAQGNVEDQLTKTGQTDSGTLITAADDPLSYGEDQQCLARQIDLVHTPRSGKSEALVWHDFAEAICAILRHGQVTPFAIGDARRERLQHRVQNLINDAKAALANPISNYIFELAGQQCCLHKGRDGHIEAHQFSHAVASFLGMPNGPVRLCKHGNLAHNDQGKLLATLTCAPALVVLSSKAGPQLHYRDDKTSHQLTPLPRREEDFLQSLSLFIALAHKRGMVVPKLFKLTDTTTLEQVVCHRIDDRLRYRLVFRKVGSSWSVQCGQELWTHRKLDFKLLALIRRHILQYRQSGEDYPIYLNDIELEGADFFTSLSAKFSIETGLSTSSPREAIAALNLLGDPL